MLCLGLFFFFVSMLLVGGEYGWVGGFYIHSNSSRLSSMSRVMSMKRSFILVKPGERIPRGLLSPIYITINHFPPSPPPPTKPNRQLGEKKKRTEEYVLIRPQPQKQHHNRLPRRLRPKLPLFIRYLRRHPSRDDILHVPILLPSLEDEQYVEAAVRQDADGGEEGEEGESAQVEGKEGVGQQALEGAAQEDEG